MRIETSPKIPQGIVRGIGIVAFPLWQHKIESDEEGKHDKWTAPKHIVLTTLAILTDVGFNSTTVMLAFSGYFWGAAGLKSVHTIGAWKLPQPVTNLKNRIFNKHS